MVVFYRSSPPSWGKNNSLFNELSSLDGDLAVLRLCHFPQSEEGRDLAKSAEKLTEIAEKMATQS